MKAEFSGIERRLSELMTRLGRLEPLRQKTRTDFEADPFLRDIAERNLEVAVQCCLDISHRIISIQGGQQPRGYAEAIILLGELHVLPPDFAHDLASIAGFRNVLVHEYLQLDWDEVYQRLQHSDELLRFAEYVRLWLLTPAVSE